MVAGHYVLGAIVIVFSNMNKNNPAILKLGFYFDAYLDKREYFRTLYYK